VLYFLKIEVLKGFFLIKIPKDDKKLLLELTQEKKLPEELILSLVKKAIEVRYQTRVIGLKDDFSELIKEYANKKKNDI